MNQRAVIVEEGKFIARGSGPVVHHDFGTDPAEEYSIEVDASDVNRLLRGSGVSATMARAAQEHLFGCAPA